MQVAFNTNTSRKPFQSISSSTSSFIQNRLLKPLACKISNLAKRIARPFFRNIIQHVSKGIVLQLKEIGLQLKDIDYKLQEARVQQSRFAVKCGETEILVRSQAGYVLCPSKDPALLSILIETGDLEPGTRFFIERYLKPGDVFIDVGANIGLHTLSAARAMEGEGRIIAFEPFDPTIQLLKKTLWLNGYSKITETHQAAVSNHAGHQLLYLGETCGYHSIFPLSTSEEPIGVEVPVVTLDNTIDENLCIKLIKIDVEGAEIEVIEGARQIIENNTDIGLIVEFGSSHLSRTGRSPIEWFSHFEKLGLSCRAINERTGHLEHYSVEQLTTVESVNLFFARPHVHQTIV